MNMNNMMGNMRQGCGCGQMNTTKQQLTKHERFTDNECGCGQMNIAKQQMTKHEQCADCERGCQSPQCTRHREKKQLMLEISRLGFAMTETILFLDTHPEDENALNYYIETKDAYQAAVNEYEQIYGPINSFNVTPDNYRSWVSAPMPWETASNA